MLDCTIIIEPSSLHLFDGPQNMEGTYQVLVNAHKSSVVLKLPTVIGSCKYCHQFSIPQELVTFFNDLMSSANQINIKFCQCICHDILSKRIAYVPFVISPTLDSGIGV